MPTGSLGFFDILQISTALSRSRLFTLGNFSARLGLKYIALEMSDRSTNASRDCLCPYGIDN
jgi:hypothetical protein